MRPCSTSSGPRSVAWIPPTHWSARLAEAEPSISMLWIRLYAITGSITFSSKLPLCPARAMVASLPITCAATMAALSAITGLTLPGMMEEPGCTSGKDGRVHRALGLEVVLRLTYLDTEVGAESLADSGSEIGVGVDAGADGGTTEGDLGEVFYRIVDALYAAFDLARVAAELLAQADRGGILEVRPPGLDDAVELASLYFERLLELPQAEEQVLLYSDECGEVDGGRDDVVGGLALVDVVVGVGRALGAQLALQDLDGPVGDDLVGVHVRGGATPGLEDV